ncbi:hypothetical protein [Streptococcus sp. DD13]|uniref:hypothetical protein n=1 Tax=Streptococcus sp. DD13 TaxID=1777881 RepID=UPI00079A9A93|nr:hypothetical protein [Streptococcus sp. DD13]KXT79154.1 putative membrane protein [Streptococcus sp. DD13]
MVDYGFHLTRIVGLAQSIRHGDFLPNINHLFTYGTGYPTPMFYGNWALYLPALAFILTKLGTVAFAVYTLQIVLATTFSVYYCFSKMTGHRKASFYAAILLPIAYPLFGYGMTLMVPLVPCLLYAIHRVLFQKKYNPIPLALVIALLIQGHILSTMILAITSIVVVLFLIRKLDLKGIQSFVTSLVIGLLLSIGFILQFLEQARSQQFFYEWKTRDFPFKTTFTSSEVKSLFQTLLDLFFKFNVNDASSYLKWLLFASMFWLFFYFKKCKPFTRVLLGTSLILLLATTNLLPWTSVLRHTFLSALQYPNRLIFFVPIFLLLALVNEGKERWLRGMLVVIVPVYLFMILTTYHFQNKVALDYMRETNRIMSEAYVQIPALKDYLTPSGDEYYTIDVHHKEIRDRDTLVKFDELNNATVRNIRYQYNRLSFDIQLQDPRKEAVIVLPKIWYKGYRATYSAGAQGSQPALATRKRSQSSLLGWLEKGMKVKESQVLYNGKMRLTVTKSGHVDIYYQKTWLQTIGFVLETAAWIFLAFILWKYRKKSQRE